MTGSDRVRTTKNALETTISHPAPAHSPVSSPVGAQGLRPLGVRSSQQHFRAGVRPFGTIAAGLCSMKCPQCQANTPDGSRFCNQCGAPLAVVCEACTTPNPLGSRFCAQCGFALPAS